MKVSVSWFTRAGFGLGKIKEDELRFLNETFTATCSCSCSCSLKAAVQSIKTNVSAGYYRNLEYRASQTRMKSSDEDTKQKLTKILTQLRTYNWGPRQELATPISTTPPSPLPPELFFDNEPQAEPSLFTKAKSNINKECIRTLTKEETIKFQQAILDGEMAWNKLNVTEYNLNGTFPRFYRIDSTGNIKHIGRIPQRSLSTFEKNLKIAGNYKTLECKDKHYVELRLDEKVDTVECNTFNSLAVNKLRNYPSACQSLFVQRDEIISSNGGIGLKTIIYNKINPKILDLHQFKQLTTDIYDMQKSNIYMTDIKPSNLVCKPDGRGPVFLVDLDSVCYEGNKYGLIFNLHHITLPLYDKYDRSKKSILNREKNHIALCNISTYALLLTIIEATTGILCDEYGIPLDITSQWIKLRVKEEHQNTLLDFIEHPHLQEVPLNLAEMLNFTEKQSLMMD